MGNDPPTTDFAKVVDAYRDMVYRIAYNRTRSHHDADDVTQDVLVKLYAHTDLWQREDEDHLRHWLARVTIRECVSLFRRYQRSPQDLGDDDHYASDNPLPEATLQSADEGKRVRRALFTLPESYRDVLYLRYGLEMSTRQVADVLGLPEPTVRTRLVRGRKRLAKAVGREDRETDHGRDKADHGRGHGQETHLSRLC